MSTPIFQSRLGPNGYDVVRVDTTDTLIRVGLVTVGAWLLLRGSRGAGILGVGAVLTGFSLLRQGFTQQQAGAAPSTMFRSNVAEQVGNRTSPTSTDEVSDAIDQASMSSFPASDPPGSFRTQASRDIDDGH